jgi:hypothetical protein
MLICHVDLPTLHSVTAGFLRLTVTDASGKDAPSPGDQGIALEVPGFAFLMKPLDGDGEISRAASTTAWSRRAPSTARPPRT